MIEKTLYDYLSDNLDSPVYMEVPDLNKVQAFYTIEKTGSSNMHKIDTSTFAIQSWSNKSLFESASMNVELKKVMENFIDIDSVTKVSLSSDYNYTDITTKHYRYQALFNVTHY